MNCKQIQKILPDYMDNNLTNVRSDKIRLHLQKCNNCFRLYERLEQSMNHLKPTATISEQPFYYTRLKQRMENKTTATESIFNPIQIRKVLQPVLYLSSLILAVYIGILIGSNSGIPNQYSKLDTEDKSYIEEFADNNYLNDFEIEPIENLFLVDSNSVTK